MDIIKKDGSKESFDSDKIKRAIFLAAETAGLTEEKVNEATEQVLSAVAGLAAGKTEITSSELRDKVLETLDRIEPVISAAWREYNHQKKGA